MTEFKIGDRLIGDGHPAYIVAEIGVNHNGLLPLAIELIDAAVDAGADVVKFQKRKLENLYPQKYLDDVNAGEKTLRYMLPILQKVELSDDDYFHIVDYCKQKGVTFMCTPWDNDSADFLVKLGVPAFKVGSPDMTNLPLIDHLIKHDKPIILSTGMSRMEEVETTVAFLKERGAEFALLHCNSAYPASFEDINLRFMDRLRQFGVPVGYSGHERGISVSTVAAALGASIIERHITLDRTMEGPDHASSLEPHGFKKMVRDIRQVTSALGTGEEKFMSMGEMLNREVLGKSLVAAQDIAEGETISLEKVTVKGPGQGLSPQRYSELVDRTAVRAITVDEPFLPIDLGIQLELDAEHTLPMQWGIVARYRDLEEFMDLNPRMLEFHLTDKDLDEAYTNGDFDMPMVLHAPEYWDNTLVDLCTTHEKQRRDSVALAQKAINVAREVGTHFQGMPKVIVHPGAMSIDVVIEDKARLYDNLHRSVEELDCEGVELLLENLPHRPWYFGGQWLTNAFMDSYEIIEFLDSAGLKTMCFDTSHSKLYCNWAGVDFNEQVEAIKPYIGHLHLSDAAGLDGEGLQVGEGWIDWVQFFQVLGDYKGTMVPEIWRGHQRGGEGFRIAIVRLTEAYNQAHGAA